MLTIFAMPKPFRGHIGIIQRNAIRSWMQLQPACEIMLMGDEMGTAAIAQEFGLKHIPMVTINEYGTPLVSSIFEQAQNSGSSDILCYINADIILMNDFMQAVQRMMEFQQKFLMVGQRWDIDLKSEIAFDNNWELDLQTYVNQQGKLQPPNAIDYFVFRRNQTWRKIPPFAIGRTKWDNWLIYGAWSEGAAVVNATSVVMAVHQNHDYAHLTGGKHEAWGGVEAKRNLALAGGEDHVFTLEDANWLLTPTQIKPVPILRSLYKQVHRTILIPLRRFVKGVIAQISKNKIEEPINT